MKLELLAPAGRWESMLAAVQNGADAVYLGGEAFNARMHAGNFGMKELRDAVTYCHVRDVRVYATCNTLLLDRELPQALSYASRLYEAGVDALIVQDLGLIRTLRHKLPACLLHASTQMAIHDEGGLGLCETLGIRRAVLARELSLSRVRELASKTDVELECFAHGALCTAVSGMCLFSSLAGGQSGNRGMCKQTCRKAYAVDEGRRRGYPLSLEDLCMLFHVRDLADAGVRGMKLEGRMKRPEYVSAMTRAYRMAIDGAPQEELKKEWDGMRRIFSRGGGTGYYFGLPSTQVQAGRHTDLQENDAQLQKERDTYAGERRQYPLSVRLNLRLGLPARLFMTCRGVKVHSEGDIVLPADKQPNEERFFAQIAKLGGTPFVLEDFHLDMPRPAYVSVAALNAMRRQAVDLLQEELSGRRIGAADFTLPGYKKDGGKGQAALLAIVADLGSADAAFQAGADWVAVSPSDFQAAKGMLEQLQHWRNERSLLLQLPAVDMSGGEKTAWEALFAGGLLDGGIAQNAGQAGAISGMRIAGYLCNAANEQAIFQLMELGFDKVLLSLELNRAQINDLLRHKGTGIVGYGRAQLMQLRHCPAEQEHGCMGCEGKHALIDEAGREFPLDPVKGERGCLVRVRNCETMDILDLIPAVNAPELLALEFSVGSGHDEIKDRVQAGRMAMQGQSPPRLGKTRGHWSRGWE